MASVDEKLTEQFLAWELRGRGWQLWDEPVVPEPPFRPFFGHYLPPEPVFDDGRKATVISDLAEKAWKALSGSNAKEFKPEVEEEPLPDILERSSVVPIEVRMPSGVRLGREEWAYFFASLTVASEPVAFELVGSGPAITIQLIAGAGDAQLVRRQIETFVPEAAVIPGADKLIDAWQGQAGGASTVVDFGLEKEFMLPLSVGKPDAFLPLLGVLEGLANGEVGVYQAVFSSVRHRWAESVVRSVTDEAGRPFFDNAPELLSGAKDKVSMPLYAASLRLAAKSGKSERTLSIIRNLAGALRVFDNPSGNALIPLSNDEYPVETHEEDMLRRQTRRSGMIVNGDELAGIVHLPSASIVSAKLFGRTRKTKAAPQRVPAAGDLVLGLNSHLGVETPVSLAADERVRHMHVIGASGTGKSTLLFNLIRQDVEEGRGVAVLDPHGDLVDRVLGCIPRGRVGDVVLIDPSDAEYPVGFNILFAHSELEKTLLASDLVSVFERLSASWGDQMASVLQNSILAFLESERGGSLADLRRFLLEPTFREEFLGSVRDPEVRYYWQKAFPSLTGNRSIGPVLTRLDSFLAPKSIRYMVSQTRNRIDFADILDSGKILLAKLAQGLIGRENSYLLGTLIISKLQQTAMARQARVEAARRDFFLYVDEFHNFITPSMAEILTGARKYRLGLILAHQEMRQLDRARELGAAVLSNCHTRICFRVGDADASALGSGLSSFEAKDLQNLGTGEAICRIEKRDFDFNLTVPLPAISDESEVADRREAVLKASRTKYATPRAEVETALWRSEPVSPPKEAVRKEVSAPPIPPPKTPESPPRPVLAAPDQTILPKAKPAPIRASSPGRGGQEHKNLQTLIKQWAEGMGWRATVEKEVLDGKGSVDVALEKGERRLACEISVTTPPEQEISNVKKCVAAGFGHVFVIAADKGRVFHLKEAVLAGLNPGETEKTRIGTVEELFAFAGELSAKDAGGERTVRGYKVKVAYRALDPTEREERERAISQAVVKSLRKPGEAGRKGRDKNATLHSP